MNRSDHSDSDSAAYRIVSQIAAERTGLLYRAIRSSDGSPIDVLVLRSLEGPERERAAARISLVKQLHHPAVAAVIDVELAGEDPSCLLEPVSQRRLVNLADQRLEQGPGRLLSWAHQIASALAAGHRLGLAHGGLSPNSIYVRDDGGLQIDYLRPSPTHESTNGCPDDTWFRAPELADANDADAAADAFSLAALMCWIFSGEADSGDRRVDGLRSRIANGLSGAGFDSSELGALCDAIQDALSVDPSDRATAQEICGHLEGLAAVTLDDPSQLAATSDGASAVIAAMLETGTLQAAHDATHRTVGSDSVHGLQGDRLGRYRILGKLGEGGMGEVLKAEDTSNGDLVAIKVLRRSMMSGAPAVRRFYKEARMLGEIKSPYVTNLLEVNQDQGVHYIVMDFVSGVDLRTMIRRAAPMAEPVALSVIADVARGLASAHERGIVHRDIKPGNILLAYDPQNADVPIDKVRFDTETFKQFRVKLSDFGLAREIDQSESMQMTRAGGPVGTPLYMSPEQFTGESISAAADIYSMGITLYEMLAGKTPFSGPDISKLINQHCQESPPPLQTANSNVSEATCQIVQRAIAKKPKDRYSDAGQMLADIERLLRGEANSIDAHPQVPAHDSKQVFEEVFEWQLQGDAAELWPYVSNTDRINSAVGVPSVSYDTKRDDHGRLRKYGVFRMAGLQIGWEEHPFEWVEGQRLGILREFHQGPFVWFLSIVELIPRLEGGTLLRHTVRIFPRGLMGRMVATLEVTIKGKRNLDRVYRRIDQAVTGGLGRGPTMNPFAPAPSLPSARSQLLEQRLDRLSQQGINPVVVDCLSQFLRAAPAQELGRIRPIALAKSFSVDPDQMIAGCLSAAKEGLLDLHWDILCPTCRVSTQVSNTLKEIKEHANCEVCDLDFEVDLAKSVELIFRANHEVREADVGTYCIGGPEHSPHVVMQLRLPPGKRVELSPVLTEGQYVLRSAQLPYNYQLRAMPGRGTTHTEIVLSSHPDEKLYSLVRAGRNVLIFTNDYDREIVVRLERCIPTQDVLTAAHASSLPMFRELFPEQSPQLGQLIKVSTISLLAIELVNLDEVYDALNDVQAFARVRSFRDGLQRLAHERAGATVRVMGGEVLLAFESPRNAVSLVTTLAQEFRRDELDLQFRAAVHRGTVLATSADEHLDYFGSTVHLVRRVMQQAGAGELWITEEVAADPQVASEIQEQKLTTDFVSVPMLGRAGSRCQRVTLS